MIWDTSRRCPGLKVLLTLVIPCSLLTTLPPIEAYGGHFSRLQQPNNDQDLRLLEPGVVLKGELAKGRQQSYRISLNAGQYLKVSVEQQGIDVAVVLSGPDGKPIMTFNGEIRLEGQELVSQVAEANGEYRLTVRPAQKEASPGRYEIRIEELRNATESDRELQKARKLSEDALRAQQAGKYDEALRLNEQALAIHEQRLGPDHPEVAASLNKLASVYLFRGEYAKAEPLFQRALAIREKALGPDHLNTAGSLSNLSSLYRNRGDYEQAEPLAQRAVAILEKVLGPDHPAVALALSNLSNIYLFRGDYERAEPLAQRVLAIYEKALGPEETEVADALNDLGAVNLRRGEYAKAEAALQRSLAIYEKVSGPDHPEVARVLNNLSSVYTEQRRFEKSEQLLQRALAIKEKTLGPDHPALANSLGNLAGIFMDLGDNAKAEPLFLRALAIREKALGPDHPDTAGALLNLGYLYVMEGDEPRAEPLHRRALAILEKALGPEDPEVARALLNLAFLYYSRNEYAKAEPLYQRVLSIQEKALGAEHPSVAATLHDLGRLYLNSGEYDKAEPLLLRSLAILEKVSTPEHHWIDTLFTNLAVLYAAKGDLAQAVSFQARANALSEHDLALNLTIGSERQKLAYLALFSKETDLTLSLHAQVAPRDPQALDLAFTTWLRRKGRGLEAMADTIAILRGHATPEDRQLFDQLAEARSQLATFMLGESSAAEPETYQLKPLKEKVEKLEATLSSRSAEFRAQSQPVTLGAVQAALPAGSSLIDFAVYQPQELLTRKPKPPHYLAYLLEPQGPPQWVDLGEAAVIDRAVNAWRMALRNPRRTDVRRLARAIDEKVMRPVRALLPEEKQSGETRRLLISPDGALNLIPFAALVDEQGRYLVERYSINYLVSGRDLLRLQLNQPSKSKEVVVMAAPDYGKTAVLAASRRRNVGLPSGQPRPATSNARLSEIYFPPLKGTAVEAQALKTILPQATVLTGGAATEARLKRLNSPRILHLATHGFFLRNQELELADSRGLDLIRDGLTTRTVSLLAQEIETPLLRSGLALAGANLHPNLHHGGAQDDGILTALEAAGLDLLGTKLVVLSACDTGVGEVKNGEGVYGLRSALVLAGSETQVMSLWPVSDLGTRDLMIGYYRALDRGEGRGEGLRRVQLEMLKRKDRRHPFYWACFIQSGEWANLDGKR